MFPTGTRTTMAQVIGFAAALGFASFAACVSDAPPPPPVNAGLTDAATTDADARDADGSDAGGALDANVQLSPCKAYCDDVMASCTGDLRAYDNQDQCLTMCALIPPGQPGDKAVNSVACRAPFAELGGTPDNCAKASAYGGNLCGSKCEVFCDLVDKHCLNAPLSGPPPYASKSDCVEACDTMAFDPNGPEGPGQPVAGPDTLNCRMYHLILSLGDRDRHCPHVAVDSETCRAPNGDGGVDAGHVPPGGH